jgi:hypothetical protein
VNEIDQANLLYIWQAIYHLPTIRDVGGFALPWRAVVEQDGEVGVHT